MADGAWLTILGIGDNGLASLNSSARQLFENSKTIIAPARVLEKIDTGDKEVIPWTTGFADTIAFIKARQGQKMTLLATGDPMYFGIGATLCREFREDELLVVPSPSGFSLAAAKLGWPLQDVMMISLHGRAIVGLQSHILPQQRILSLTSNAQTIKQAAEIIVDRQYGPSKITVLEHIGGDNEKITSTTARDIVDNDFNFADFNMLAIECIGEADAIILPSTGGLPDDVFSHDGQLTKREIRAVTLANLAPVNNQVLWDIGAGCGSVAIEWMRGARKTKAYAVERFSQRCEMIAQNAIALGVPDLEVVEGNAIEIISTLPRADAIFIGGGLTHNGLFDACWDALGDGKRLVANGVTVQGEAILFDLYQKYGGELIRLQVSKIQPVGKFSGWKPLMPVTIWSVLKGEKHGG